MLALIFSGLAKESLASIVIGMWLKKIFSHSILRVWFIIEALGLLAMLTVHLLSGRHATLAVFIFMVFLNVLILFFSKPHIYQLFENVLIEGEDSWGLTHMARKFAALARIPTPEIYLLHLNSSLSYSFSNSSHGSAIFLSETLVEDLSNAELESLIAFEVARITLGQSFLAVIASSVGYIVNLVAENFDKFILMQIFKKPDQRKCYFENLMAPLVMALSMLVIRKSQNLAADDLASKWLGEKKTLAVTLWKLDSLVATRPIKMRLSDSYLFSVNPLTNQSWNRYFLLQATVKRRIFNLVGHYPV